MFSSVAVCTVAVLALVSCVNPLLKLTSSSISPPVVSPGGGVFGTDQSISLSDTTSGATIYYTTDGTTPTTSSTKYSGAIAVAGNGTQETIEAIAVAGGKTSAVVSASFTINYSIGGTSSLASPTFSPAPGLYTSAISGGVTLSGPSGASIYYTTNGSAPSASNGTLYAAPITIPNTNGSFTTVKAVSVESGFISSPIVTATYEMSYSPDPVTPTVTIASSGGSVSSDGTHALWVTGASPTVSFGGGGGSTTYYYTIGYGSVPSTPTTASTSTTGGTPVTLAPTTKGYQVVTVDVVAEDPGTTISVLTSASFSLNEPLPTPTTSLPSGRYSSDQTISFSDSGVALSPSSLALTETNYITTIGTSPAAVSGASLINATNPSFTTSASTFGGTVSGELTEYTVTVTATLIGWAPASISFTYYIATPKIVFASNEEISVPSIPSNYPGGAIQNFIAKLWGGGGGGGAASNPSGGGTATAAGGGGGGFAEQTFAPSSSGVYEIYLGAGGTGSTATSSPTGASGGGMTALVYLSAGAYQVEGIAGGGGGGGSAWAAAGYGATAGGGGQGGSNGGSGQGGSNYGIAGSGGSGGVNPTGRDNYTPASNGGSQSLTAVPTTNGGAIDQWGGGGGSGYGGGSGAGFEFGTTTAGTVWDDGGGGGGGGDYGGITVAGAVGSSAVNGADPDYVSAVLQFGMKFAEGGSAGVGGANGAVGQNGVAVIYVQ